MNQSRRNVLAIISGSALSLFGLGASAADGPLIKPKRLGQSVIYRNKKYTAIKKGKTLIWDKGVAIKPAPTNSATGATNTAALTFVAKSSEITEGAAKIISVKAGDGSNIEVSATRTGGSVNVFSALCTHRGCVVEATKTELACNCHGSTFNFATGAVNNGPAATPLRKYVASEASGSVYIKI